MFVLAGLGKAGEQEVLLDGVPRKLGDPLVERQCCVRGWMWWPCWCHHPAGSCDKGLLSVHNTLAEQQTCPRTFQWSSERGAGKRNEIFASRKGSGFGSSEVGLGLFAKIPQLAKMLVLDFITVTGLRAFH